MAVITAEINMEEMDEWFRIGQEEGRRQFEPKIVAASALGGQLFDPATGGPLDLSKRQHASIKLPSYRRITNRQPGHQYADEYLQKEQQELLSQATTSDIVESVSGELERLEMDSTFHGGSASVADELIPENATDVYKNYKFPHNYTQLPVLEAHDTIVSTIEGNQVTIIQGPTGCGKTTQVPQFILGHYAGESRYCNIVVTQPRKIAAVSIAQRVCDERGWELGTVCGYQYGMDRKVSEDTRLLYCTTGVLKEKFINKKFMHEYTHVILDEVHERDIESDFLLLIVKKLLRTNSSHVKVILMSATFDTAIFSQYFRLPVGDHLELAPVVTIGTSHHHVSEFFADELTSRLGEVPPIDENRPGISPAMYNMAVGLIKEFDLFEEKEQGKDSQTGFAPVRGTVLMFLPGLHEIMCMQKAFEEKKASEQTLAQSHLLDIICLHSTITLEEQNKAFKKPARGYRKVIVSTNIAESSITVPDIKYVIDFCLTKNLCCDPETNYPKLVMEWASKANTKQRKGRAGRVSNGRVYYMVPQWFYNTVLPEYGTPEMQRSPLDSLVLKTKLFDMGEPKALLGLALSPPDLDDIGRTILSLKEVGALSSAVGEESNPYDGTLTFLGRVLASLPVDIRIGKMLVLGHVFGVLEECLIIGASLSVKSFFANPMQSRFDAFRAKFEWSDNSLSDCIAALNAYKTWENRVLMKEFERAGATENQWGRQNFLQPKRMKEVSEMVQELEERLKRFNIVQPRHKPRFKEGYTNATERLILKIVLCGAFYPNYAIKEETDEKEAVKLLSGNDPYRTVMVKGLPINQGILYVKQLQDIFRRVQRDPPVRVSCEQTRAFIEFTHKSDKSQEKTHPGTSEGMKEADKMRSGKIIPGVCLAIKLRQVGIPMHLNLYDKEETQRRLADLQKTAQSQRPDGNLRTNRLKAEEDVADQQLFSSIIDPDITILLITVTEVIECGHFWAQCDLHQTRDALIHIQSTLNNARKPLMPLQHSIQPGHLVAARYKEDSIFYRARVEDVHLSNIPVAGIARTTLVASVFFVDYGNTDQVPVNDLRALPQECQHLPFLAVEFYLSGLRPSSIKCADGVWSHEAKHLFSSWTLNKSLIAQVYSVVDNTVRVELVYKFPNGQEVCLNEKLIEQGFADKAEESFRSQQNHEQRINQRSTGIQSDKSESWLNVSMSSLDSSHARAKGKGRKVNLSGPVNPLEMTFASLTLSGRHKVVKVDPESVNSVAVDDDPQNKFSRLLVAGCISMNPTGNSMIARDTTILPQIPGLPALVTLLFAPYTEYRTDPKRERYTGALCGLGFDEEGLSHLPDHDIELEFETTFGTEDIVMINEVRMAINLAVGTEDTMANWGEDIFVRIQDGARQKLLALLKKSREPVVPKSFSKLYEWNQLDPDTILKYNLTDSDAETPPLLRLHQAVSLVGTSHQPAAPGRRTTEYYLEHLKHLEKVVQSHQRQPIRCELCKVTLANSHILAIHMQTERHLRQVSQLHEGKHHLVS